jgi:Uma2 family endonuclease
MPEGAAYTYADLVAYFPVDNVRREIIDGELIVSASPVVRHQRLVMRLLFAFAKHLEAHGGGEVFASPLDTLFSDSNVVQPDVMFIAEEDAGIVTDKNVQGVPSLVVEVVSDPRMDLIRKKELYARYRVPEYWVVEPDFDYVQVFKLAGDDFGEPVTLGLGNFLTYDRLPGLAIDLVALFAR